MWLPWTDTSLVAELRAINANLRSIIMSIASVRADYKAFATEALDQRDTARAERDAALALAESATAAATKSAADLQAVIDNDAADDLVQLQAQQDTDAQGFQSDLADLKQRADAQPADPVEPAPADGDEDGTVADVPVNPNEPVIDPPSIDPATDPTA